MINANILKQWMLENNGSILYDSLHPGVFSGYVTFTPERAREALENNTRNRKVGERSQVPILREALRNGLWDDNVSKINFAKDDTLSDGQNRLVAIVMENISARLIVTYGVDTTAQLVTDRRGARSLTDDIEILGYKDANHLAAITRIRYRTENGMSVHDYFTRGKGRSDSDIILYYYFNDNVETILRKNKIIKAAGRKVNYLKIDGTVLSVLANAFDDISYVDAEAFWKKLGEGLFAEKDDPIYLLHKRFLENAKQKNSDIPKMTMAALIIKAWNFYMRGEKVQTLRFIQGGAKPEQFPEIYNPYNDENLPPC